MPTMLVEWSDDPASFARADWDALAQEDPDGTIFHGPSFLKLYWEEFGSENLSIGFVTDGPEIVACAAFDVRHGVLTFLGGFEITDYLGPVGLPMARGRAAKELMAAIAARDDWQTADLRGLPEDGAWLGDLVEASGEAGLASEVDSDGIAPLLPLPETYDTYLAGLQAKRRHELRRKTRRLREAFPDARIVDATMETLAQDLDRFIELHRGSPGAKGKFMHPRMELFFRRLAEAFLPAGLLRLVFLEAGGERIAGLVGFRDGSIFRLYNSAYDRGHRSLAPGVVLVAELIQELSGSESTEIDLLKGDLEYKYRFGAVPRRIACLHLRR
jgi:CelD/BcsL family acetyltransferase involved in cellulose biosynthesis